MRVELKPAVNTHALVGVTIHKPGCAFRMEGGDFPARYDNTWFEGVVMKYDKPETDGDDGYDFVIHWRPYYEMRGTRRVLIFPFDKETMTEGEIKSFMREA